MTQSGWLSKCGKFRSNWADRWFVLESGSKKLEFFSGPDSRSVEGTIELSQVLSIAPCDEPNLKSLSLSLVTPDRTWILSAEKAGRDVLHQWIQAIEQAIGTAKRLKTSKEAFLSKQGKSNSGWKSRYFALGKGWLFYFAAQEDCAKFREIAFFSEKVFRVAFFKYVRGSIPLQGADMSRSSQNPTHIVIKTSQREFVLQAQSQDEASSWVSAMRDSLQNFVAHSPPAVVSNQNGAGEHSESDSDSDDDNGEEQRRQEAERKRQQQLKKEQVQREEQQREEQRQRAEVEEQDRQREQREQEEEAKRQQQAKLDQERAQQEQARQERERAEVEQKAQAANAEADIEQKYKQWLVAASAGVNLIKHGKKGSPHERLITIDEGNQEYETTITWGDNMDKTMLVKKISEIRAGKGQQFQKKWAKKVNDDLCIVIAGKDRELNLECPDKTTRDLWLACMLRFKQETDQKP